MNEKEIRAKIRETEEQLKDSRITLITANDYAKLLEIHNNLWNLLYTTVYISQSIIYNRTNKKYIL